MKTVKKIGLLVLTGLAALVTVQQTRATGLVATPFPLFTNYVNGTTNAQNSPTNPLTTAPAANPTTYVKLIPFAGGASGVIYIGEATTNGTALGTGTGGGPSTNSVTFNTSADMIHWTATNANLTLLTTNYSGATNVYALYYTNLLAEGISLDIITCFGTNTFTILGATNYQAVP